MSEMLETIGCLLRKAESTSEHEADALIQAAQRLATMYAIDIEVARPRSVTSPAKPITPVQGRQIKFPPRLAASIPLELGGD